MFKSLFSASTPADGFTQPQREALVDLLLLCMYSDARLSTTEADYVDRVRERFTWPAAVSYESYEAAAVAKARATHENPAAVTSFLQDVAARLETPQVRQRAYELARGLLASDGETGVERVLLDQVHTALLQVRD